MSNIDPEALAAAQLAYERSNASLKDYNPATQQAVDLQWVAVLGGPNTHPAEPVLTRAEDSTVTVEAPAPTQPKSDSK